MPDKAVLFLVVELCTLSFRPHDRSKSNIVASALFGDGAAGRAAALRRAGTRGRRHRRAYLARQPGHHGLGDRRGRAEGDLFARHTPARRGRTGAGARDFLKEHGLALSDIDRFVCHPGGPKVVAACETAFALAPGALVEERGVLRDFGNMSAASVLFVLERVLAADRLAARAGAAPC